MTARGIVRFEVSRDEALHAGLWILVYGPFDRESFGWRRGASIGDALIRTAQRKGGNRVAPITIALDRADARWLWNKMPKTGGTIIGNADPLRSAAGLVGRRALRAVCGKRGRPRFGRADALARVAADLPPATFYYNLNLLDRIDAIEAARAARWKRLHPLGETILKVRQIPE